NSSEFWRYTPQVEGARHDATGSTPGAEVSSCPGAVRVAAADTLDWTWPGLGSGRLRLVDVAGRRRDVCLRGNRIALPGPGVYFVGLDERAGVLFSKLVVHP
ncbi:MAG: hypothetical protein ABIK62_07725, partial [candidate division WOR-3 bacterium]